MEGWGVLGVGFRWGGGWVNREIGSAFPRACWACWAGKRERRGSVGVLVGRFVGDALV